MKKLVGALKSKTMWLNAAVAAATGVVEVLGGGLEGAGIDPSLLLIIVTALNMGLRWITSVSLDQK